MRTLLAAILVAALSGCGPAPTPPVTPAPPLPAPAPAAAGSGPPAPLAPSDPFAVEGQLQEEWLPLLKPPVFDLKALPFPAAAKGVPPAPASCSAFVKRAPAKAAKCKDAPATLAALDAALSMDDVARRDAMLADLEACPGLPVGLVRSMRVELGPIECGDVFAEPMMVPPPAGMTGAVYHALFGHAIAARLARTGTSPPKLAPPYEVARVKEFLNGPMASWMNEQARALQETAEVGARLPYYGKGVVAVEAGMADMRYVDVIREAPIPDELAKDKELRDAYYGPLEKALDPRKDRGRDAALVGLKEMAYVGVVNDDHVERARRLLSRLYGGRRIDALDLLALPPLAPAAPATVEERLAAKLPTFYAGLVLQPEAALGPGVFRQLVTRGLSVPHRIALKSAELSPEMHALYARARIELGRRYWRAFDFDQAVAHALAVPKEQRSDEVTFLLALGLGLRGGPEDAGAMMRKAPLSSLGMGRVAALDALAAAKGKYAGIAALDAALIKQLATPPDAGAAHWRDLARRYRDAAAMVTEPAQRSLAEERARAAEETAAAIK